eukprot:PhF_6_TR2324/c0_g1_i1/m.4131
MWRTTRNTAGARSVVTLSSTMTLSARRRSHTLCSVPAATRSFAFPVGRRRMRRRRVSSYGYGFKKSVMKAKLRIGLPRIQNLARSVRPPLRRMEGATTWCARNVNMSFVGFVKISGRSMATRGTSVIFMRRRRILQRRRETKPRGNLSVTSFTTPATARMTKARNLKAPCTRRLKKRLWEAVVVVRMVWQKY